MEVSENFKSLGLISIIISWIAGFLLVYRWRGNRSMSLSLHAAAYRPAYFLFAITLTFVGALFYLFAVKYFIPTFHLPSIFTILLLITLLCQFIAAWTPDKGKYLKKIHRLTAYSLAAFLPVLLIFVLTSSYVSLATQAISVIAIIFMSITWYLFIFVKSSRPYYLIYQSLYIVGFHLAILTATYVR